MILNALNRLRFNVQKELSDKINYSAPDQAEEIRRALKAAKALLDDAGV